MKKVYTQAKKVPACPRCEDIAAWKHDAKGRWWCKTCNKAFTPGITGANLTGVRAHALKKDPKQDPMRITRNKIKDEESSEEAFGLFDPVAIKAEEANDQVLSARRLSKTQAQFFEFQDSSPANKIRKLTARRSSTDRYKQMLEEEEGGDDSKLETSQEAGDEQGVVDEMVGEDVKPADAMVRVRSERPKKAPYACPHTDKPYYAKGKCRPCYWAEWRREGGKKGHAQKLAAEQAAAAAAQQISFEIPGTSPEAQKLNKKKKLKGSFGSYEVLPQQKKAVAIDDAQCVAFRLNKASDYQAIHDLLMELRSFYITGEILKGSHLLLVVKRLTQNPSSAVSELAKALFEEFAEILNEQRGSGNNSPMNVASDNNDSDNNNTYPNNLNKDINNNQFMQTNILQQTNYVTNTNFAAFQPTNLPFNGAPSEFGVSFNPAFSSNNMQTSPHSGMFVQQPSFQMQNQPNPAFNQPTPPVAPAPTTTKSRRQRQSSSTQNKAVPFNLTHSYNLPQSTDPLAQLIMNNNMSYSQIPTSPVPMVGSPASMPVNVPVALPGSMAGALPDSTPGNQMRLVQEITMMNSALAHITNMNYSMLNNLNTMRTQTGLHQVPNMPAANTNAPNMGQIYVTNPNAYSLPQNFSYSPVPVQNFVPYATAPFDASLTLLPVSDMSGDNTPSQQAELDAAQMVESMLQNDDDATEENNGNYTLECTDYNHSPTITTFTMGEEAMSTTDANTEHTSTPTSTQTPLSGDNFSRDTFSTDMTNDSSCNTSELELSDNYLTFLA